MFIDPYKNKPVYCPVCGLVVFWDINVLGEVIVPKYFSGKTCNKCGHEMIVVNEPFENFHLKGKCAEDERYFNRRYIIENYILNNPEYNSEAHKRRLMFEIDDALDFGVKPIDKMFELRYFFKIERTGEQPRYVPASTRKPKHLQEKQSKDASVIGRGVVGGIAAGPVGAVVGALSAVDKNAKNRSGK